MTAQPSTALNAICPYFTMFPLDFPLRVLRRGTTGGGGWVLDPFSGRGTTNYAARVLGLPSVGIDSSNVAVSLTQAKLANVTPDEVVACADEILSAGKNALDIPMGEFWDLAYHPEVLATLCQLREDLLGDCTSDARRALRATLLGALHGPLTKRAPSHLSNQCTRTYAPKPNYAVRFWTTRGMHAPRVDVRAVVKVRATRYYTSQPFAEGFAICGDSRSSATFEAIDRKVRWTVTSPPFYGMRTYVPDQWLRNWFVGGPASVDYSNPKQLDHPSPAAFARQLRDVWRNVAEVCRSDAQMVVRFGGISDRDADPLAILKESVRDSPWRFTTIVRAGSADQGRRQATHFSGERPRAATEHDAWLTLA